MEREECASVSSPLRSSQFRERSKGEVGAKTSGKRSKEAYLISLVSVIVAVVMTWPAALHPRSTIPQDLQDPIYFVWQLGWMGHALRSDLSGFWSSNAFLGSKDNLAYTDVMVGYAPLAAIFVHSFRGAVALYNILLIFNSAFAFAGSYVLARVLGANWKGALLCGAAFAYAPWHLNHERHLNVLSIGGVALSLALIAYGHDWRLFPAERNVAPSHRGRWIFAGWLVAIWQLSLGFAVGLSFSWILAIVYVVAGIAWVINNDRRWDWRVIRPDVAGGILYAVAGAFLIIPYLRVAKDFPAAERTVAMVNFHSPPVHGLLTAPADDLVWGSLQAGARNGLMSPIEQTLLPGFVVLAVAILGIFYSKWNFSARLLLGLAVCILGLFALGTHAFGGGDYSFLILFRHVPGWKGVRTSGRLILWVSLGLGLLAAGFISRLSDAIQRTSDREWSTSPSGRRIASALLVLPAVAALVEGVGRTPHPHVPSPPVSLSSYQQPILVLPVSRIGDYLVMAWSVNGLPVLANGGSGFDPPDQINLRRQVAGFPDANSVAYLRSRGVKTVILDPAEAAATPWAEADQKSVAGLNIQMQKSGKAIIYKLS
jgi:hypothetical protein